jgi:hypothetical protein
VDLASRKGVLISPWAGLAVTSVPRAQRAAKHQPPATSPKVPPELFSARVFPTSDLLHLPPRVFKAAGVTNKNGYSFEGMGCQSGWTRVDL